MQQSLYLENNVKPHVLEMKDFCVHCVFQSWWSVQCYLYTLCWVLIRHNNWQTITHNLPSSECLIIKLLQGTAKCFSLLLNYLLNYSLYCLSAMLSYLLGMFAFFVGRSFNSSVKSVSLSIQTWLAIKVLWKRWCWALSYMLHLLEQVRKKGVKAFVFSLCWQ